MRPRTVSSNPNARPECGADLTLLQLTAFHQRLLEQSNATQRRQPGSIFVAALAHAAADLFQTNQDHDNPNPDHRAFLAQYVERSQQYGDTNQDYEHSAHFFTQAAGFFTFTTAFFFSRFHNRFLFVVG